MPESLAERLAVVETKVGVIEGMADKIDDMHQYIVAEKAKKKFTRQIFAGIAGVFAFAATLVELFRK